MATVNILLDCTCSMSFCAADAGGGESYITPTSFKADKITIKETTSTADHSTGQDRLTNNRVTKTDWEISVDTKQYLTGLYSGVRGNDLGQLTLTAPSGFGVVAKGVISDVEYDVEAPSTLKFSLKCHGTALTVS